MWRACSQVETLALQEQERGQLSKALASFGVTKLPYLRIFRLYFLQDVSTQALRSVWLWTGHLRVLNVTLRPSSKEKLESLRGLDAVAS